MSELYSFSKETRLFSKPLYQPSSNAVSVIPFENGKFKSDDTKAFSIGMVGRGKSKIDNVLKPNGISGSGQYIIQFHFFISSLNLTFFLFIFCEYKLFLYNLLLLL